MTRLFRFPAKTRFVLIAGLCLIVIWMAIPYAHAAKIAGDEPKRDESVKAEKIIGSKATRLYYLPGMAAYGAVKPDDQVVFDTEAQAVKAGFRRAVQFRPPTAPAHASKVPTTHQTAKKERYVTIDFDSIDIAVFAKFVSELTEKNFVIDERVKGKVTVISPKKIPVSEVYKVFESVLEVNGFAAIPSGDVIKIIPSLQAREKGVQTRIDEDVRIPEDKVVTQIFSLEYANPDELKKIIEPLISKSSVVLAYAPTGMLIVTDILSNIKRLQEIITALDVEGAGEQLSYIPLKYATASEVAKSLTTIFQQQKGIAPIRIVAEDRTNALIILASEIDTERIKKLIAMVDKGVTKDESLFHIYKLQNATSDDLAKVLMNLPKDANL